MEKEEDKRGRRPKECKEKDGEKNKEKGKEKGKVEEKKFKLMVHLWRSYCI